MPQIGLFDSGVGGLSVWRAVARELPQYDLVYFADSKYCPYGPRPQDEIRALSKRIVEFLISENCGVIVVACNTASAAALYYLRETFPPIQFVGMEPAVKPAALATRTGKVAVLATPGTLDGELFTRTRDEHAREIQVFTVYPDDWVERVERGDIASSETEESVRRVLEPLLEQGVDMLVLGCTHYPFLAPTMKKIAQGDAMLIDPSDAVALRTASVVLEKEIPANENTRGTFAFYTSGDARAFELLTRKLIHVAAPARQHLADELFDLRAEKTQRR